jgi:uncharacterized protein
MSDLPRHLKLLDKLLLDFPGEPMLLSELDGFLTGVIVCPELIMPGEWLPQIWGVEDGESVFENSGQAERMIGLVMEHYNTIAYGLNGSSGELAPLFEVDTRHNETLWELWIDGFDRAMDLRPDAWTKLLASDEDTRAALGGLMTLAEISHNECKLPKEEIDDLTEKAPDLIPSWVEALHEWRLRYHTSDVQRFRSAPSAKVGRNDPCPCGSEKKYKKCCGLN